VSPLLPDGPIDSLGVLDTLLATPESVAAAAAAPVDVPPFAGVHGMVLVASGADALVAEAAQALVAPWSPVPVFVHTGHGLPAFVSDEWRCVSVSRAPTPESTSALRAALDHRAVLTAVGSGEVVEAVAEHRGAVVRCPDEVVAPRFSFASTLVSTLRLLDGLSALATPLGGPGLDEAVDAAVAQLMRRRDRLGDASGDAALLARRIGRTMVLVYGAGPLGAVAARRWKQQVNDNVKAPAFDAALPQALHHELSGWGQHGDMTRQVFSLVELRHDHEHAEDVERLPRVEAMLEEVVHARHEVRAEGAGPLAQLLDLVLVGDLVSWHLAQENEIDPGPRGVDTLGA
jgi:glucose/mannose-6-phosphate isomerase